MILFSAQVFGYVSSSYYLFLFIGPKTINSTAPSLAWYEVHSKLPDPSNYAEVTDFNSKL